MALPTGSAVSNTSRPSCTPATSSEYGDIREPDWREFYERSLPTALADKITVPVLYSESVTDPRINNDETEVVARTLRANGVEAPYVRFPDEGRGWRNLSNQLFYFRREAEFL
jgi:dipeptidyl aminopeptidase/acylaminoacyl peptidase